ncbi:PEP-utilizing enzyme [Haloplanus halophilus]|uniref:PEP-utilizing enzyme n=1 Tax=Haloplanus halophilus TaxID=2949993 RepID=UPI003CCCA602
MILGETGSPGRATGSAQCIEADRPRGEQLRSDHLSGVKDVQTGDIVVMPDLLPAMCELVDDADGFVVYDEERLTGRGPTYARQLGIPAIINCPQIRSIVETGDQITVDSNAQWILRHRSSDLSQQRNQS